MDHLPNSYSPELEWLAARVTEVERRLSELERENRAGAREILSVSSVPAALTAQQKDSGTAQTVSVIAVSGRALLGLAGAYLLRAAFESNVAPKLAVAGTALLLAGAWLFLSVHAARRSKVAGTVYGITSALIIFPMLWETTVNFRFLPTMATAVVLVAWLLFVLLLVRRQGLTITRWVTALSVSGSAAGLFVAMRDPLPFTITLIASAALTEYVACRQKWPGLRIASEGTLDLVLCVVAYLATRPGGFPAVYTAITVPALQALFAAPVLIIACGVAYRTIFLNKQIVFWDIAQTCVTFALALGVGLQLGGSTRLRAFGVAGFLAAVACYLVAFWNGRIRSNPRSFGFYHSWAGGLFLISSYLVLPVSAVTAWLSVSAVVGTTLALRTGSLSLGFHGLVWLLSAEGTSGLLGYARNLFAGSFSSVAPPMAWLIAISAVASAIMLFRLPPGGRGIALVRSCSVANVALLIGAFGVAATVMATYGGNSLSVPRLAVVRTLVICLVTVALAIVGSRKNRRELIWVAYLTIGLGSLKLLFEDLRSGSSVSFAFSLLAFGVLLAIIPRVIRTGDRTKGLVSPE